MRKYKLLIVALILGTVCMLCGCGSVNGHGDGKGISLGAGFLLMQFFVLFTWGANIIIFIVIEMINLKRPHAKPSVVIFVLLGLLSLFDLKLLVKFLQRSGLKGLLMYLQNAGLTGLVLFLLVYFSWVLDWILLMRCRSRYKQENSQQENVPENSDRDRQ